jgi:hypothetical protein
MIKVASTATLSGTYVRVWPADDAFTPMLPEPPDDLDAAAKDALRAARSDRAAAFAKFDELGDVELLAAYAVPGRKPTQFVLRHLTGLLANDLTRIIAPTLTDEGQPSNATLAIMAHLSISAITDWDGPALRWTVHRGGTEGLAEYSIKVLHRESLDALATVPGLLSWLGWQALGALTLPPL